MFRKIFSAHRGVYLSFEEAATAAKACDIAAQVFDPNETLGAHKIRTQRQMTLAAAIRTRLRVKTLAE